MLDERLLRERIIWLEGEVRDENSDRIAKQLQVLAAEDHERDISLYINSPGGSITAGMVIYDTMQLIPNDITTVAMGLAASMGQFLLTAGAAGKRYVPQFLLTTRSFRPLAAAHRQEIRTDRLRIVLARSGEDLRRLGERTNNEWDPGVTALINGYLGNETFDGGEWMKVLWREAPEGL